MSLPTCFLFLAGMALEVLWLWHPAHAGPFLTKRFTLAGFNLQRSHWLMLGLPLLALFLAGLAYLLGLGDLYISLDNYFVGLFFVCFGLYILTAGVVSNHLLPRVNEKTVLGVQIIIAVSLLVTPASYNPWALFFLLELPMLVTAYLVARQTPLGTITKAVIYCWYLFSLVLLAYQNGSVLVLEKSHPNLLEGFLTGVMLVFLLLHMLFSIRFFLVASSLIIPANRPLVGRLMPHLFSDEQVSPRRFILLLAVILAIIGLNAWLKILPMLWLVNLAVILSTQLLFRPEKPAL